MTIKVVYTGASPR